MPLSRPATAAWESKVMSSYLSHTIMCKSPPRSPLFNRPTQKCWNCLIKWPFSGPLLVPEWEANSGRRILPFAFQTSHTHTCDLSKQCSFPFLSSFLNKNRKQKSKSFASWRFFFLPYEEEGEATMMVLSLAETTQYRKLGFNHSEPVML